MEQDQQDTTQGPVTGTPGGSAPDPRVEAAKRAGQGEAGREMLEHVRQGAELSAKEEKDALDWLLGTPTPIVHTIPVDLETDNGMATLTFVVPRCDPRKIEAIEMRNINQSSGRVDRLTCDFQIAAEMSSSLRSAGGREVKMTDDKFLTVKLRNTQTGNVEDVKQASAAEALERRFVGQEGVITLVAAEIRRLAGYDSSRLGTSQRQLVEASLG